MEMGCYEMMTKERVTHASGTETALDDFETATFAEDHVGDRYFAVLEGDMTMAVRCVIITIDAKHTFDGNARGVSWDKDNGLLLVFVWVVWRAASHGDVHLASVVTGTR
jgi:hypothetical protein